MVIIWIVVAICVIMSGVLLSGRGGFLIAGYNTSSAEEKAKYDEKKLCRVMGIGLSFITIIVVAIAVVIQVLGDNIPIWIIMFFILAIFVDVGAILYFSNTKCYATNVEVGDKRKETSIWLKVSIVFTIVICLIVGIVFSTGNIVIAYGENSFTIKASYWSDKEIAYSDVESIEYSKDIEGGSRTNGFGGPRLQMGSFKNSKFGKYTRYTYTRCDECVVLTVKEKKVVISGENKKSTQAIYEELLQRCEK
ncbi:DUF3784 domain-containing protein [Anaerosporobacter sp.]